MAVQLFHQMDRSGSSSSMSSVNAPDYDRSSQDAGTYPYNGKVLLAAVILLSIVVFFVILLHIYARWFIRLRPVIAHAVSEPLQATPAGLTRRIDEVAFFSKGLDAKVVASLPVFVCEKKEGGESAIWDCVVCLSVMEEGEVGRMLPRCKHVFHVECIDMWLGSHSTCPICRDQVKGDESGSVAGDGAAVGVEVVVVVGEEAGGGSGEGEGNVTVELPLDSTSFGQITMKGDESSSSSSSSSSLSCSLKRMVSKSRSESRVFPSVPVN